MMHNVQDAHLTISYKKASPFVAERLFFHSSPLMVLGPFFTFSRALRQMIKWLGANGHLALGKRLFALRQHPEQVSSDSLLN